MYQQGKAERPVEQRTSESRGISEPRQAGGRSARHGQQVGLADELNRSPRVVALRGLSDALNAGKADPRVTPAPVQRVANRTGLPDGLKASVEALSGLSMDHVKVHYNSPGPERLNALAYTEGSAIHVAPGQERHLPHEAWHVVQQARGGVRPTVQTPIGQTPMVQMKDAVLINDDRGLEREADLMGAAAARLSETTDVPGAAAASSGGVRPGGGSTPGPAIVQRLKKGDFADLAGLGLDVATWIDFAAVVRGLGITALNLALQILARRRGADLDTTRAKLLVERQKFKLRKGGPTLLDHLFGPPEALAQPPQSQGAAASSQPRQIAIGDGVAETTYVRTASDLLVWLVSHPAGSANTPRDWANSATLLKVLDNLGREQRMIDPLAVWEALRAAAASDDNDESDDESDDGAADSGSDDASQQIAANQEPAWEKGEWGEEEDEATKLSFEKPLEFRRQMSSVQYQQRLQALRERLRGYKLVGVHATRLENVGALIAEGVSSARFNTGHGVGKGNGFYAIPTPSGAPDLAKATKTAQLWGSFFVEVYLPDHCELIAADDGDTVQSLDALHKRKDCYYQFGKAEIVIPPALCSKVILVRDPADITMADPGLPAVARH